MYTKSIQFNAEGGSWTCVEMPAPTRGRLDQVSIKQIGGTEDAVTFDVLNRRDACEAEAEVSSGLDDIELMDKELHRVIAQKTFTSPAMSESFNMEAYYENQDERDISGRQTSKLYLDIDPGGSGTKTFQMSYTCVPLGEIG